MVVTIPKRKKERMRNEKRTSERGRSYTFCAFATRILPPGIFVEQAFVRSTLRLSAWLRCVLASMTFVCLRDGVFRVGAATPWNFLWRTWTLDAFWGPGVPAGVVVERIDDIVLGGLTSFLPWSDVDGLNGGRSFKGSGILDLLAEIVLESTEDMGYCYRERRSS